MLPFPTQQRRAKGVEGSYCKSVHTGADEMLEAADSAGTRLAVAENYQFMADSTEACRLIASG